MAARKPDGSKAGRNEGRKLTANLLNALSTAALLAALLQPGLALLTAARPLGFRDAVAAFVFGALAIILHMTAQAVVRRLED